VIDKARTDPDTARVVTGWAASRDATVKHVEFQDTSVVVGNSGGAEEDPARELRLLGVAR
jgi:hypothetical protein